METQSIDQVTVSLSLPTADDPFNRVECRVLDVGHADRVLVVESDAVTRMAEEHRQMYEALQVMMIGAATIGVPHRVEREVFQDCINRASAVMKRVRGEEVPDGQG